MAGITTKIFNLQGKTMNISSPIHICNYVWIGCRSMISKSIKVADHSVITVRAVITKTFPDTHSIYGGNNLKLKRYINWEEWNLEILILLYSTFLLIAAH